jgi:hypothetical protein
MGDQFQTGDVGPVQVFQDQQDGMAATRPADQLDHGLEQLKLITAR